MRKILILGATGMLGHVFVRILSLERNYSVYATEIGNSASLLNKDKRLRVRVFNDVNVCNADSFFALVSDLKPDIIVNCAAIINSSQIQRSLLRAIELNAEFPHRLSLICKDIGARLVHISTDGVFDGKGGMYRETDPVAASDAYSMTKYLGEVGEIGAVTLRTSIIGHQLQSMNGLLEWFLSEKGPVVGYKNVVYSGFPTVELVRIVRDYVLPNASLSGVYHVSSNPISKYDLLKLIAKRYSKDIEIRPSDTPVVNRSLDSSLFQKLTGYKPPSWDILVDSMYKDYCSAPIYKR